MMRAPGGEQLAFDWLDVARAARRRGTRRLLADTPRARKDDSETSHQAADTVRRSGELGKHQRTVLEAVVRWPGRTSAELGKLIADSRGEDVVLWRYRVGRRLSELAPVHIRRGRPRTCETSGNAAGTWFPVG